MTPGINLPSISLERSVTYSLSETATRVYVTTMNQDGGIEQGEYDLPFKKEFNVKPGALLSLVGQNKGDIDSVKCEILVNGQVIKEAESNGAYVVVTCAGMAN